MGSDVHGIVGGHPSGILKHIMWVPQAGTQERETLKSVCHLHSFHTSYLGRCHLIGVLPHKAEAVRDGVEEGQKCGSHQAALGHCDHGEGPEAKQQVPQRGKGQRIGGVDGQVRAVVDGPAADLRGGTGGEVSIRA